MKSILPFCVILTHRHGACIGIFLKSMPSFLKADFINTANAFCVQKKTILNTHQNIFEFFSEKDSFVCARVLGKTAENLSHLFQFSCHEIGIGTSDIKNFVVGTGPGSFTGLRLGCAFVNGLHLAVPETTLFSLPTLLVNELRKECEETPFSMEINNELIQQIGAYNQNDHSSGYVTFFDLFYALHQIVQNKMQPCPTLTPNYGKVPSPVLNLNLRKE